MKYITEIIKHSEKVLHSNTSNLILVVTHSSFSQNRIMEIEKIIATTEKFRENIWPPKPLETS
jgi:hypothetical protein